MTEDGLMTPKMVAILFIILGSIIALAGNSRGDEAPLPITSIASTSLTLPANKLFAEPRCAISYDLKVSGDDRAPCVELLERAAKLARAEMRVNAGIERAKKMRKR